jgi:hypothetical protein
VLFSLIREREINRKWKKKKAQKWGNEEKLRNSETEKWGNKGAFLLRATRLQRDEEGETANKTISSQTQGSVKYVPRDKPAKN